MANTTLSFNLLAKDNASRTITKVGQKFGALHASVGKVGRGVGVLAPALAGLAVGAGLTSFINDARESAKVARLTEAVVRSTGGAAKLTAEQVGDLATAISNKTGADDEAIQSGQNLLLTFTNIRNGVGKGNDIFNQASQAITDMTAAMNGGEVTAQGMKASSIQLGKALNDPIKGVTALSKVGVSFTKQQKDQIKTLVESGNTMGAQKIILAELNKEFGGAAAAASDPLTRLKTIVGNLSEQVGGFLLPVVDRAATFLGERVAPAASRLADVFAAKVTPKLREFGEFAQARIVPVLRQVGAFVQNNVLPALMRLGAFVRGVIVPFVGKVLSGALEGARAAFERIREKIEQNRPQLERLGAVIAVVVKWVADKLGPILSWLAKTVFKILGVAIGVVITVIAQLVEWIPKIVTGITDTGKVVATFFKGLPGKIKGWVGDTSKTLYNKGKDFIGGLVSGFAEKVKSVATFFGGLPGRVVRWQGTVTRTLLQKGRDFIGGLLSGFAEKVKDVASFYAGIPGRTVRWIGTVTATLKQKGRDFISGLSSGLTERWTAVATWISQRRASVVSWIGNTLGTLKQKGRDVITGFWDGLKEIWSKVTGWVGGIAEWIRKNKGPVSLDRTLLVPAGRAIMEGFLTGLKSGAGPAWDFVTSVGGKSKAALASALGVVGDVLSGNVDLKGGLFERTSYQGETLDIATLTALQAAQRALGGVFNVMQGSYEGASSYSGFTHTGGGVLDVDNAGKSWAAAVAALRSQGFAAWHRTPSQGPWGHHIHAIQIQNPTISASARSQVLDFLAGGDGLAGYRQGTPWVPNDQLAILHRGEAVVPAHVNRNRVMAGGGVTFNLNGTFIGGSAAQFEDMLVKAWDDARRKGRIN